MFDNYVALIRFFPMQKKRNEESRGTEMINASERLDNFEFLNLARAS